jgi:hypothetical protein
LAVMSGCRSPTTATWLSSRTRSVTEARNARVATGSYQTVLIAAASRRGMATWSQLAMYAKPERSAARAISTRSSGPAAASHASA